MPAPTDAGSFPMWPTILGIGGTLIGLIVGFGLKELSSVIRSSREDRRTIGKALAELLEVRHHLKTLPLAIESLKASLPGPISGYDEFMFRKAIWFFLPNTDGLQKRYEDAVSAVAGAFPTLAFELRSKDAIGPFIGRLRETLPIDPKDVPLWLKMEDKIIRLSMPKLDELIRELAKLHKRTTAKDVKAILKEPVEVQKELEKFYTEMFAAAIATAQAAQANAPAPEPASGACQRV